MRPGSRWNGKAANPISAALCGAIVSLLLGYALSYLFTSLGMGVVSGQSLWRSSHTFMLAGLNVYASQHVPLLGSGILSGDEQQIHALVFLPLTVWAAIPIFSLIFGGWCCARMRINAGKWGMVASAIISGIIYACVMVGLANIFSAKFASTAIPAISGWELSPPQIPFHPSRIGALRYGLLFGIVFSYLGAMIAVHSSVRTRGREEWWACGKSVVIVAIVLQLLMCGVMLGWVTAKTHLSQTDRSAKPKFVQVTPAATGIGYALIHGAKCKASATPIIMPSAAYSVQLELYRGVKTNDGGKISFKPISRYTWIGAILGAIAALMSGTIAVKFGARGGSLPIALRITVVQSIFLAVTMELCRMGWGIVGQSSVSIGPFYTSAMLIGAACTFVLSLIGAHWANGRRSSRIIGFPSE